MPLTDKKVFFDRKKNGYDRVLFFSLGALIFFGLLSLSSASVVAAYYKFGSGYHYFNNQLTALVLGLIPFFIFLKINYHRWQKLAFAFLFASCLLLSLVFIPGLAAGYGNAKSWISIFGFSVQPSEFVKIFFLIYLAAWLESRAGKMKEGFRGALPFFIVLGAIAALMLMQPDLGTLIIIFATALIVYFVGGGRVTHIVIIFLIGLVAAFSLAFLNTYQMDRLRCVVDNSYNSKKECYQLNQALIAVGSGGFLGRGLGEGRQKFLYLPEVSGDSVFAAVAEEIGFLFSAIFVIFYVFVVYRGFLIAKRTSDVFGKLLAAGISSWIAIQFFINIGGVLGIIPMTGVPLPFVSQGGSSLIASLIGFGILLNISKQN